MTIFVNGQFQTIRTTLYTVNWQWIKDAWYAIDMSRIEDCLYSKTMILQGNKYFYYFFSVSFLF